MTYTTEEFVRREVGRLLRVDYRGKFLCPSCLVKLALDAFDRLLSYLISRGDLDEFAHHSVN